MGGHCQLLGSCRSVSLADPLPNHHLVQELRVLNGDVLGNKSIEA